MEIPSPVRTIARGRDSAGSLEADQACALFEEVLAGRLSDAQRAAVLLALRVKGETLDEIEGAMRALAPRVHRLAVDDSRPTVAIPDYDGARRLASLTPLLGCLLADAGLQVVVHGVVADPQRTTTAEMFGAMGIPITDDVAHASDVFARRIPVFVPIGTLSPALATLLALPAEVDGLGLARTLAKMLNPTTSPRCLRLVASAHPESDCLQHDYFIRTGEPALIARGTDREAVASMRVAPCLDWLADGECRTLLDAKTPTPNDAPVLPDAADLHATARWIQSVLAGEHPVPVAIEQQVACVLHAIGPIRRTPAAA